MILLESKMILEENNFFKIFEIIVTFDCVLSFVDSYVFFVLQQEMDTFWSLYEGSKNFLVDWGIWNFILIVFGFYVLQRLTREPYKRIKEYNN